MHDLAGDDVPSGQDPLLTEAYRLRANPKFEDAVREYTLGLAKMREAPWLANKLVSQDARFRVVGYLLYLDADREQWPGGASYGRIYELCTRRKEVGVRVLKTMLALLTLTGFVQTERDAADRRVKYYRPTQRMADFVTQWLGYVTRTLDILEPETRRTQLLGSDRDFAQRFLVSGGRDHMINEPPANRMPEFIQYFGAREGGSAVVLTAIQAKMDNVPLPSRSHIARRYGLSKTQVSNVIAEGINRSLFALNGDKAPAATELLHESYRKWIAIELAFYTHHM